MATIPDKAFSPFLYPRFAICSITSLPIALHHPEDNLLQNQLILLLTVDRLVYGWAEPFNCPNNSVHLLHVGLPHHGYLTQVHTPNKYLSNI